MPTLRPDRPALLVSSTSWTPDEDFSILLEALGQYEQRARSHAQKEHDNNTLERSAHALPKVLVAITGKGPLKESYMRNVERLQRGGGLGVDDSRNDEDPWRWVRCIDMWLEVEDYPLLLGNAGRPVFSPPQIMSECVCVCVQQVLRIWVYVCIRVRPHSICP